MFGELPRVNKYPSIHSHNTVSETIPSVRQCRHSTTVIHTSCFAKSYCRAAIVQWYVPLVNGDAWGVHTTDALYDRCAATVRFSDFRRQYRHHGRTFVLVYPCYFTTLLQ